MPMRPAAFTNRLVGVVSRLDSHIRHPAVVLPLRKILRKKVLDRTLAFQVFGCNGSEVVLKTFGRLLTPHPLDAVKALLENVVGARLKVAFLPKAQTIATRTIFLAIVATQRR